MTDEELADHLNIPVELVPRLGEKRAAYENLVRVGFEIDLWEAGLGPKPQGVIVCHDRHASRSGEKAE